MLLCLRASSCDPGPPAQLVADSPCAVSVDRLFHVAVALGYRDRWGGFLLRLRVVPPPELVLLVGWLVGWLVCEREKIYLLLMLRMSEKSDPVYCKQRNR